MFYLKMEPPRHFCFENLEALRESYRVLVFLAGECRLSTIYCESRHHTKNEMVTTPRERTDLVTSPRADAERKDHRRPVPVSDSTKVRSQYTTGLIGGLSFC